MQFTMNVKSDSAAFDTPQELSRMLRIAADQLDEQHVVGHCIDHNGNLCGEWSYTPNAERCENVDEHDESDCDRQAIAVVRVYDETMRVCAQHLCTISHDGIEDVINPDGTTSGMTFNGQTLTNAEWATICE